MQSWLQCLLVWDLGSCHSFYDFCQSFLGSAVDAVFSCLISFCDSTIYCFLRLPGSGFPSQILQEKMICSYSIGYVFKSLSSVETCSIGVLRNIVRTFLYPSFYTGQSGKWCPTNGGLCLCQIQQGIGQVSFVHDICYFLRRNSCIVIVKCMNLLS